MPVGIRPALPARSLYPPPPTRIGGGDPTHHIAIGISGEEGRRAGGAGCRPKVV